MEDVAAAAYVGLVTAIGGSRGEPLSPVGAAIGAIIAGVATGTCVWQAYLPREARSCGSRRGNRVPASRFTCIAWALTCAVWTLVFVREACGVHAASRAIFYALLGAMGLVVVSILVDPRVRADARGHRSFRLTRSDQPGNVRRGFPVSVVRDEDHQGGEKGPEDIGLR